MKILRVSQVDGDFVYSDETGDHSLGNYIEATLAGNPRVVDFPSVYKSGSRSGVLVPLRVTLSAIHNDDNIEIMEFACGPSMGQFMKSKMQSKQYHRLRTILLGGFIYVLGVDGYALGLGTIPQRLKIGTTQ